ncbi:hypothetical protein [Grimontia sp. NTOU-MAR1]|nr:hypothetical protein [Grimontia sp. NTOU-MAR1]WRV99828.1 hypothetical protein VP504_22840 [Grimontia sp. NTOU-MAR1]
MNQPVSPIIAYLLFQPLTCQLASIEENAFLKVCFPVNRLR